MGRDAEANPMPDPADTTNGETPDADLQVEKAD